MLTALAMLAFAANSLLCRLALGQELMDAASFATMRVISGALMLSLISWRRLRGLGRSGASLWSAVALFVYMIFFSFAYLSLAAGTGALILFAAVQLTMFVRALRDGEPFPWLSRIGLLMAVFGLIYLVSPGLTAPEPLGALSMVIAGAAWGIYSLQGRRASDPLAATAGNFLYCVPMVVGLGLIFVGRIDVTASGILLAAASGALASGLGYAIWYAALGGLSAAHAATVQLSVPVIAAIGGVVILTEPLTLRLVLASAATLGGVSMVLGQRAKSDSIKAHKPHSGGSEPNG